MWCAISIYITILTVSVPLIRINLCINYYNLNVKLFQLYGVLKINVPLIPGRTQLSWP